MITDYRDMDTLIATQLAGIVDSQGAAVFLSYAVPEETIVETARVPAVVFQLIMDELNEERVTEDAYRFKDNGDGTFSKVLPPTPVRLSYQVDLYSHFRQEMIDLIRQVFARLRRWRGILLDADGDSIDYELTDFRDISRDVEKQRLFRTALTFAFNVWVTPESINDDGGVIGDPVGRVEYVLQVIRDLETDTEIVPDLWVPDEYQEP